jgi:hypothetical protein
VRIILVSPLTSEVAMATQFYRGPNWDPYLARARNDRLSLPEIYWPDQRQWAPYPELDTVHEARAITAEEAMRRFEVTQEELEKPGMNEPPASG